MPSVTYGGKGGQTVKLEVDPDLLAVRTHSRRSFLSGPVRRPEAALLDNMELLLDVPETGVEVYRRRANMTRSIDDIKHALRQASDTRFAGRVLVDQRSGEPVVYTENLFVKFHDDTEYEECWRSYAPKGLPTCL